MDTDQTIGTLWRSKFSEEYEMCLIVGIDHNCPIVMTNKSVFYRSSLMIDEWCPVPTLKLLRLGI